MKSAMRRIVSGLVLLIVLATPVSTASADRPDPERTPRVTQRRVEPGASLYGTSQIESGSSVPVGLPSARDEKGGGIEPGAGKWQTWLIESGSSLQVGPPPDKQQTRTEIEELQALAASRDAAALEQIAYWDTGGPLYRWNEIAVNEALKRGQSVLQAWRTLALVHAAAYDATIVTWDAKYTYKRPRPAEFDHRLSTAVASPPSPAYPSEYAAVARAASAVLAHLYPDSAQSLAGQEAAATRSRLLAGVEYPSDIRAGETIGQQVADLAIAHAKADGSNVPWTGSIPAGPGKWSGTNPAAPQAGTWKTWVLDSGSELRPPPPPAYDSDQLAAELAALKAIQRTPQMTSDAWFWEYAAGGSRNYWMWNERATRLILAAGLAANPPRMARAYALQSVTVYDAMIACWDAKYANWAIRPFQLDPTFKPLFTTPNHPSYPAAHSCLSSASAATLGYLFPGDAQALQALGEQAGQARMWAGIHFASDVAAGETLGRGVATKVIERARSDGSE